MRIFWTENGPNFKTLEFICDSPSKKAWYHVRAYINGKGSVNIFPDGTFKEAISHYESIDIYEACPEKNNDAEKAGDGTGITAYGAESPMQPGIKEFAAS